MINNLFTFVRTLGNQRIEGKKFFTGQVGILGSLSDSSGSLGTAGKVLSTTGSGVQWITVGSSNVQSLNDLSDVVISTVATGNLLRYNGTSWVNWEPNFLSSSSTLGDLFNVGDSADSANDGDILRFNEQSGLWIADEFPTFTESDTLDSVTGRGATTTNSITVGGVSTSGTVTAAVVTTPLIEREGVVTINSEQQVDQGEPNPDLLYVSWLGDNKFVVNADGYAIANTGFKVVGGTSSGFLKANGGIDTNTYLTSYTETQTLDNVTDLGATTTNPITVGGVTAPILEYGGLLTIDADNTGSLQPSQGDPAAPVLNFDWAGDTQGYIDTDGKITFNGFKTPTGTSSGFLKANGTVDTNTYITEVEYIDDIGDVVISSATLGDVLTFNGSQWVNSSIDSADWVSKVQHEVKAGVAITKGKAVYVTGADGTNMVVGLASNASEATSSKVIGLAESNAAINGKFFVITEGLLDGLNTSTANAGDAVWLGTNGNLIFGLTNKPVAPAHLVYIGVVTRSNANNGEIFVNVQNGFELNELHDVLINGVSTGHLLRRDSDGLWKNWNPNYITADSVDVLTNKRINLSTGLTYATPVDSIDGFLGQNDIPLYQDGIDKGGTINVDDQGNVTISNPGIGYYSGPATTVGGSRFSVTVAGNTLTGTIAEFNAALTDGDFATQAYVSTQIANLVDGAPATLDTLNELAAALGDDPSFATTVATSIAAKQNQLNGIGFVKANGTTISYDNSSYITTESDPVFVSSVAYGITNENTNDWNAAFGWGNHADVGYLTSFTETDPIFTASAASGITTTNISNWNSGYNDKINSASFNTSNGVLTLTQQDTGTITVDLDGRYLTSETDAQTLTWTKSTSSISISNGNSVTLEGLATEEYVTSQGYITGISFANVSSKPTTIAGYGITDAITTANIGSQSVSYADSSGNSNLLKSLGSYVWSSSTNGRDFQEGLQVSFVSANEGYQNYGSVVRLHTYPNDGASAELYFPYSEQYGGNSMQYRLGLYPNAGWSSWKTVVDSENIGQYALTSLPAHTHTIANVTGLQTALDGKLSTSGKAADSELLDGVDESRFVYGNSDTRRGTNLISNWNQNDYPDVAFLSAENGGTNAPTGDYTYGTQYSFHRSGAAYRTQLVTALYSDTSIYVRNSRDSDVWTSWKRLWHSGDFTSTNISNWNTAYGWGNHAGLYLPLSGGTISGNLNVSGQLAFPDGGGNYTNIIRSVGYPSEGYPSEFKYWLEYRAFGGHHFVLNVDGGVGSGENAMDDFIVWQGAIDGDRLLELTNAGNLIIRGTFTEQSSIRFKENIKPLEPALGKVEQLKPVTYNKIGVVEEEIGLIAEEVAELFPEVVTYNEEGLVSGVQYQRLSVILLKAVQELTERVNKLENK